MVRAEYTLYPPLSGSLRPLPMSLQVFLQAQLTGTESFLASYFSGSSASTENGTADLIGRCAWLSLISELLPRALLSELKLSRMLLGSSGGEQFLLVLPDEAIPAANEFLARTSAAIAELTNHTVRLIWASTENLGAWAIVRKRLDQKLREAAAAPLAGLAEGGLFLPFDAPSETAALPYFASLGEHLAGAARAGWSPDQPARVHLDCGALTWPLSDQSNPAEDAIGFPRRFAMDENGSHPATLEMLGGLAEGAPRWAILRGDVDNFDARLRGAGSIEEHIHLSVLFKEFFAGELLILCTMPDFWRKVTILYRGGDDFAVFGSWDALVALARELQRLFEKFVDQNMKTFAGLEGKTMTMALAIAPAPDTHPYAVMEEAGVQLRAAKAVEIGTFHLFGRTIEWKRLADAEELKTGLVRLVRNFGYSPETIHDVASICREAYSAQATRRNKAIRIDKPWRTYMRLSQVIPVSRNKDWNTLRSSLITNLIGKKTASLKLRPSGRIGLEWARLAAGE